MIKKVDYPSLKKAAWESYREFLPAFVMAFCLSLASGFSIDEWQTYLFAALIAGVKAGVRAIGKYLRDEFGAGDYAKLIYKLPF